MALSDRQLKFLSAEFGLHGLKVDSLSSYELWKLSEDCFGIECDENRNKTDRDAALDLFHALQKMLPEDWRFKTPPEVDAMQKNYAQGKAVRSDATMIASRLQSVPA